MEKYSQILSLGSGIAPFFPIPTQPSGVYLPFHVFLFLIRFPILLTVTLSYFLVLQWLPLGPLGKKACLWMILGVPSIWWIDLQIDGVKKGSLAKHHPTRLPQPFSLIASSLTSPIDALYLAAIFDPIFTASYPSTALVTQISLFQALLRALSYPKQDPPRNAHLTTLRNILQEHPNRVVVVFPECTTTNGRGILPFSPSLLTAPPTAKIFPVSLRYTPGDITTPIPGTYLSFLWTLLSKPTHCIRVRIAESVYNDSASATHIQEVLQSEDVGSSSDTLLGTDDGESKGLQEKSVLNRVAEALARLGRVKRVGLGVQEKKQFVDAWKVHRRR
ncbi:MAG: hypothetical protein M1836_000919 [Candelina mexicana]|nr:MAG: hypothetical protein M1836_000919 [Candelina mexicana]